MVTPGTTDTRSALLASAQRLFSAHGYDGVGVQAIVEEAGVTKPTLYHHFGNKRGLLEALLSEGLAPLERELTAAAEYQHDVKVSLERVARVMFDFARREPTLLRLHLGLWFAPEESEAAPLARRFHERPFVVLERLFEAAAHDHGNMKGRARAYAATFLGMLNSYVAAALNHLAVLDEALVRRAVHQFMHGIFS